MMAPVTASGRAGPLEEELNRTIRTLLALLGPLLLVVLGVPAVQGTAVAAAPSAGQATRYTMTAFTNSSESNMYVYDSPDATGFTLRKGPAYSPPSGLIRDPSIIKHTDGFYYLTYTTNWTGNTIGFARSADRVNWTFLYNYTIPISGLTRTWAPEWFVDSDGSVNIIVSLTAASTATHFTAYKITATDSALTTWSAPTQLAGIGPNNIDTFVVKVGSTYHAFTKNETTKYIEYATASSLTGPYTIRKTGDWAGFGSWVEGPALVQLDNGGWRIYYDGYRAGKYWYSDSYDNFATWSTPTEVPGLTGFIRHATVLKETVPGGVTLPINTTRSLQSVNFPGRYAVVRSDNLGYVDPVTSSSTTAVKQSATFTVVPGLADANCYSFRDSAGRYLRHWDFRARFDSSNGTDVFNKDATYCARPGATSGSARLESYNYPGRYLRHYNYALRVDLYQDNDTFRADSSFTVVSPWA
ncbi:Glycosyl hydrolases family 43 [Streptomyces sp. 1222.2]|nr:Glycosyl hydrolases family 43 [Streptomyces sp. 1222.2]